MNGTKRIFACIIMLSVLLSFGGCKSKEVSETTAGSKTTVENIDKQNTTTPPPPPLQNDEPEQDGIISTDPTQASQEPEQENREEEREILEINGLVLINDIDPEIEVELKYATSENFANQKVYPYDICVLQRSTAEKLAKANQEFMKLGYRIKVWDAYRPVSVQRTFWEIVPDSRYVANPDKGGSKHNRGTAVDVTLIDMKGNELEMPSGFDDFSGKGSRNNTNMSDTARDNMNLLTDIMVRNGFTTISSEWWHYNDSDSDMYGVIDVNLEEFLQGDAPSDSSGLVIDPFIDRLGEIVGSSSQVLLVVADKIDAIEAKAYAYEKKNGLWQAVFEPMDVVFGSRGLTDHKQEGDKKSPIGIFPLERCYGRVENPGTKLTYTQFAENDFWVDDPESKYYNTYQKGASNGNWKSAEDLYAIGQPYKYFIVIEYNTKNPLPGNGSAIFLHIWKEKGSPTAGCTAMSEQNLLKVIRWLDPTQIPVIIQTTTKGEGSIL